MHLKILMRLFRRVMVNSGEFCILTGRGLGPYSEQTVESVHHDVKQTRANFKIKDLDHSLYGEQLLKAVCMYNSKHL